MRDENLTICRCEEVTLGEVLRAIRGGARTVAEVRRRTRCGMGLCQGRSCGLMLARVLASELGVPVSEVTPGTVRSPVVPIMLNTLSRHE